MQGRTVKQLREMESVSSILRTCAYVLERQGARVTPEELRDIAAQLERDALAGLDMLASKNAR